MVKLSSDLQGLRGKVSLRLELSMSGLDKEHNPSFILSHCHHPRADGKPCAVFGVRETFANFTVPSLAQRHPLRFLMRR